MFTLAFFFFFFFFFFFYIFFFFFFFTCFLFVYPCFPLSVNTCFYVVSLHLLCNMCVFTAVYRCLPPPPPPPPHTHTCYPLSVYTFSFVVCLFTPGCLSLCRDMFLCLLFQFHSVCLHPLPFPLSVCHVFHGLFAYTCFPAAVYFTDVFLCPFVCTCFPFSVYTFFSSLDCLFLPVFLCLTCFPVAVFTPVFRCLFIYTGFPLSSSVHLFSVICLHRC